MESVRELREKAKAIDGMQFYNSDGRPSFEVTALVSKVLASTPEDEETEIDEAWLVSLGGKSSCHDVYFVTPKGFPVEFKREVGGFEWRCSITAAAGRENIDVDLPSVSTRGAVRTLLSALGIK